MIVSMSPRKSHYDRYRQALLRLEIMAKAQKSKLPRTCAEEYRDELVKAIVTQKYASQWASNPYSEWYADWKKMRTGSIGKFWVLFGDLIQSITINNRARGARAGWFAGVPAWAKDSGGKSWFSTRENRRGKRKPIAMYAKVNERLRPLFGPSSNEYQQDRWPARAAESFRAITRMWRP